ncbi:MAG: mitochondrial Homoaconitase [Trichoglossum hirsutum]|nr:MAG: mitochondrial Homoaconitase [Trichoglossum hirsutum]
MLQRPIVAKSPKSQRVSSCISRRLQFVSRRSLKMKVASRLCLRLGVSHSRPPVDLVSDWQTYLASPEAVAASALSSVISGTGLYEAPANYSSVDFGYGTGSPVTIESELGNVLELESLIDRVESSVVDDTLKATTKILSSFSKKISSEIKRVCMASVCMLNYDLDFELVVKPNDIRVSSFNFGCRSSREQAVTAILAKQIPLVVAGSFENIFSQNSINNALLSLKVPRLIERLRATFTSSDKSPTRRTEWTLTWDVVQSVVKVQGGKNGYR